MVTVKQTHTQLITINTYMYLPSFNESSISRPQNYLHVYQLVYIHITIIAVYAISHTRAHTHTHTQTYTQTQHVYTSTKTLLHSTHIFQNKGNVLQVTKSVHLSGIPQLCCVHKYIVSFYKFILLDIHALTHNIQNTWLVQENMCYISPLYSQINSTTIL